MRMWVAPFSEHTTFLGHVFAAQGDRGAKAACVHGVSKGVQRRVGARLCQVCLLGQQADMLAASPKSVKREERS